MKHLLCCVIGILLFVGCNGCSSNKEEAKPGNGGYLFAHMTTSDYGAMYYSVSQDGINWTTLNSGKKVSDYRGHPDFCLGKDGRYYMIGIQGGTWQPVLWATKSMITWGIEKQISQSVFNVDKLGHKTELIWYGAPKMFYDEDSGQYIITWHAAKDGLTTNGNEEHDKPYWRSIRTFYVLTSDFVTFTEPQRLFNFTGIHENMPTMDAIIRKVDGKYYSFIKDERWPGDVSEGYKAIRITKSENLTGPYENPGQAITDTWREAQTLARNPRDNGWYLFVERYPIEYTLYEASQIEGPWVKKNIASPDARHGSVVRIDETTYQALLKAFK